MGRRAGRISIPSNGEGWTGLDWTGSLRSPVHPIDTLRRRTPVEINTHLK